MTNSDIKRQAKQLRKITNPSPILVVLGYVLVEAILNAIPTYRQIRQQFGYTYDFSVGYNILTIVLSLISQFLAMSFAAFYCLKAVRQEPTGFGDPYGAINDFGRFAGLTLLTYIFVFLWSLLFVIPGIIGSFRYAMAPYILRDNPGMTPSEALKRSKEMMVGNKWRLFCLQFSFIGWLILSALTFGVLSLWVIPYMGMSQALFYEELSGNNRGRYTSGDDDGSYTMASFSGRGADEPEYRELVDDEEEMERYRRQNQENDR